MGQLKTINEDSVYSWKDLRRNHLEVEWGENLHSRTRTRRERAPLGHGDTKGNWLSATIVVTSTLIALAFAALVALTLIDSPIPKLEGNPSNAQGIDSLPIVSATPTQAPTNDPTSQPTLAPTPVPTPAPSSAPTLTPTSDPTPSPSLVASGLPSAASSRNPSSSPSETQSQSPSESQSVSPSAVPKAPPAPEPESAEPAMCVDQSGVYHNHAGDKVPCEWFSTVGTYNFHKNCDKTDLGRACLLSCKEYNDCIMETDHPSVQPSLAPTSKAPTASPTPEPPKTITLEATGDASIKEAGPNANLGSSSWLKVDGASLAQGFSFGADSGAFHVLLKFDLSNYDSNRPIESASLRLKAANSCSAGGSLQRTQSPHWDEDTVTWDTAPKGDGTEIGRLGIIESGFWYSLDVTSGLHPGDQTLSLRLYSVSSDECIFVSKENANGNGPELHIVYDDV
ncbi:hypothetical protein ACHAXR_013571 [Thalassiosira sp. AJA248-18]